MSSILSRNAALRGLLDQHLAALSQEEGLAPETITSAIEAGSMVLLGNPAHAGLAPIVVRGIFDIIREINQRGTTILLIEQNANMALQTAHTGYVLETGRITLSGTGEELLKNEAVQAAYLGT